MLISLAVDFHGTDLATRERLHLSPVRLPAMHRVLALAGVSELSLLATCNRSELYAWCPTATEEAIGSYVDAITSAWMPENEDSAILRTVATVRTDLGAARHLMRVASGLESQVLGDGQILGQTRRAHVHAQASGTIASVLHRLFETALRSGRRVQANTDLCSGTNSVGAQAIACATRQLGSLANCRVVIIGCGKTGESAARQAIKSGVCDLVLINRSPARAEELAADLGIRSAPFNLLHAELAVAHVAVIATGSDQPLVLTEALMHARADSPIPPPALLLVDVSMPRNVEASAGTLDGVSMIDLDSVHPTIANCERARRSAIPAAEAIVEAELQEFADRLATVGAHDAIRPLRETLAAVCRRELVHITNEEVANRISQRIVAKVMAAPMMAVRGSLARGEPVTDLLRSMHVLFPQPELTAVDK